MAALTALVHASCSESVESIDPDGPPHIVVVLVDTLRADHTSLHGYERRTTRNLERIASEGTWMKKHFVNAPWTKPSVASILTGLHPTAHGSRIGQFEQAERGEGLVEVLDDAHETFVEVLSDAGYDTVAHVSNIHLQPKWGYAQGYDDYRFVERAHRDNVVASDRAAIRFAIETLDGAERPTFVWVHMMAVHEYFAPRKHRVFSVDSNTPVDTDAPGSNRLARMGSTEMAMAHYDQAIRFADDLIGDLYDSMRRKHPNSVLVVTSDHGEEFYEHGGYEHCRTLYNELLRVPCVVAGDGVPAGVEVDGITDSLDLFPTVLGLAGIDVTGLPRPGTPLVGTTGEVTTGKDETFAEQHHRGPLVRFALNRSGRKLIESYRKRPKLEGDERIGALADVEWYEEAWGPETDALRAAPTEAEMADLTSRVLEYRSATRAWFERVVDERRYGEVTADDLEQMRALGYGGGEDDD